ncbi:hypothetical protein EfmE980_1456 [Enterococcus faecium E980]|nr:hypothetical protein EfmE980_1456 [Enterococcus faecium E980]MBL4989804.1 hypothetical protein [Enterococcus lactis]MBL5005974.1 hypothetical protein [Enterococcus lactis]MBL5014926.1 hypothetical protein [Enterococcus lactis]
MRICYLKMAFERISRIFKEIRMSTVNKAQFPKDDFFGY